MRARLLVLGGVALASLALNARAEKHIVHAYLPNRWMPQAEISLVQRDNECVVRSIIHTRFPSRVRAKIEASEIANWGRHPDAQAYRAALAEAFSCYASPPNEPSERALVIEFTTCADSARVDISFLDVKTGESRWAISPGPVWRALALSRAYIEGNQRYILCDALGDKADAAFLQLTLPPAASGDSGS